MNDLTKNVFASSFTIGTCIYIFNPLDCLRLRWQVSKKNTIKFNVYLNKIIQKEGIKKGLFQPGLYSNVLAATISRGIGIGFYPSFKNYLDNYKSNNINNMFLAGFLSGALGYCISNPFWIIKTRMQTDKELLKFNYKGTFSALKQIYKKEGLKKLYSGFHILTLRGALMNAGNTLGYHGSKIYLKKKYNLKDSPSLHIFSAINASILSTTLSTPIDYIMTHYFTSNNYKNNINKNYLFKGWLVMFLRVTPIYIIYLPFYEQVRLNIGLIIYNKKKSNYRRF